MEKKKIELEQAVIDFSEIPYERKLEERALFPYSDLNKLTGGIVKGTLTAVVADAGAGKTTMISDVISQMLSDNDKVFAMFGEGTLKEQQDKMYRQMAPRDGMSYDYVPYYKNGVKTNIGSYFVGRDAEDYVRKYTKGKLYLYDIRRGMKVTDIVEAIEYAIQRYGVGYVVLDNSSQIETVTNDETKELKESFEILRQLAITKKIGIIVLAHFRKQTDVTKFRRDMTEIIGTSALSQKGAAVISLYRMDYVDRSTQYYKAFHRMMSENGWDLEETETDGRYKISSVAEVLKARSDNGQLGFCCLSFDKISQCYKQVDKGDANSSLFIKPTIKREPKPSDGLFDNLTEDTDSDLPF